MGSLILLQCFYLTKFNDKNVLHVLNVFFFFGDQMQFSLITSFAQGF